ncbi:IclR family transcriptional regulator [Enterovirga rhinocerotis]|nr:helix-turn-helix domain-containing protein [Enterovirga rhinocerotis]
MGAVEARKDGVAAVDRALSVLGALAGKEEPSTLAELARATGLYKSTILRLAASLEEAGYLARLPDGRYGLGGSAFRLGLSYERQNPLRQHVLPVLQDLVERGTESASFHIRHGAGTRLCLFRVNSHHSTLDRVEAGAILPLDRGAAGRVLASPDPSAPRGGHAPGTPFVALSRGERDTSCAGMATAVFGPGGLVGALSLSGPGDRFTEEAVARMAGALTEAAARLTRELGGSGARAAAAG